MKEEIIINLTKEEVNKDDLLNVCDITFKLLKVKNPVFNIIIVDEKRIREINKEYRAKDSITDVISFAFEDNGNIYQDIRFLGEIYICATRAKEQAEEYGHSFKREICYLCVHGILHLLGYDHMKEEDKKIMRAKEEEVLKEYDLQR